MSQPLAPEDRLVRFLERAAEQGQRRLLAALARGRGREPRELWALWPLLGPFLEGLTDRQAERFWLVATLFGSHPLSTRQGNLGTTFAQLRELRGPLPSLEKRLLALMATHGEDLASPLRQVVGLARSSQVPLNWAQLLADLRVWERSEGGVQMAWAREFWREGPPGRVAAEAGEEEATDTLAEEPDDLPALCEPN